MIKFERLTPDDREKYQTLLFADGARGCEYSFANINIWGRQRIAFLHDRAILFSQYDRVSLYPFPVGTADVKPALDAIIHDAAKRGIPCRLSSMNQADCQLIESLYPGRFQFHTDRDHFDYVYAIDDLAELTGKRYQSKRNFANRFASNYPDCQCLPIDKSTVSAVQTMLETWFADRLKIAPDSDFVLEKVALNRAFAHLQELGLEGLAVMVDGKCIAMTMGSRLSADTFDIHFEKALDGYDGAYAFINRSFARHLRETYPDLRYLNREDDMGIPGLRKAKMSYHPHHMVEKYWARLWEDDYDN
ncbi:MAG: DUF2156 domain-containing protein [Oscillospiraceae bacterium]|nr:DUF2156 domain-containing protein [Oscillospiraceae bacterium]